MSDQRLQQLDAVTAPQLEHIIPISDDPTGAGRLKHVALEKIRELFGGAAAKWRVGSGAPSDALGDDGDLYLDADTGDVYQRAAGEYSMVANILGGPGDPGPAGPTAVSSDAGNQATLGGDSLLYVGAMGLREPPTIWTGDSLIAMPTGWKILKLVAVGGGGGGGGSHNTNTRCGGGGGGGGTAIGWMTPAQWATIQAILDAAAAPTVPDNYRLQVSVGGGGAGGGTTAHGNAGPATRIEAVAYLGDARLVGQILVRGFGGLGGPVGTTTDLSSSLGAGGSAEKHAAITGIVVRGHAGSYGGSTAALCTIGGSSAYGGGASAGSFGGDGVAALGYGGGGSGGSRNSGTSFSGGNGGPGIAWMEVYD